MGRFSRAIVAFATVFMFLAATAVLAASAAPDTAALAAGSQVAAGEGTPAEAYRTLAGVLWAAAGVMGLIFAIGSLPQWRSRS